MKESNFFPKHFTLEEARALLPKLRSIFHDLHRRHNSAIEIGQKLMEIQETTGADLGGKEVDGMVMDFMQVNAQLQHLKDLGVVLKDFNRGLVDFPHLRDGREVYLCWELDEDDIEFWHDIDAGYAGRERL
mgnify:CR=1 FL=1